MMKFLGTNVNSSVSSRATTVLLGVLLVASNVRAQNQWATIPPPTAQQGIKPRAFVVVKPLSPGSAPGKAVTAQPAGAAVQSLAGAAGTGLPLWFYNVPSSRDGNSYFGIMVGKNPFNSEGGVNVPVYVVPVVFTTNTVGVSVNLTDGTITTAPGVTTFDPTARDKSCLAAPNNVPTKLFRQSPIFENAKFNFGGTNVGNTQYLDAFQRANFWSAVQEDNSYHVLLNPVTTLAPLVLNVPAADGTTLPASITGPTCGPEGVVDINWFDSYISNTYIPALAAQGVNSGTLPIFELYNVSLAVTPAANLFDCCILGYHGANFYTPVQTYSVADFDTTGIFGSGAEDTAVLSHEISEWMNDPYGFNPTPLWGNTGQVQGYCQNNLEVGDPLTGTVLPPVTMSNGFSYHLQELAFYSWFLGKPSIGVNGWYSDNGTFLTDAGPPCQ